MEKIIQPQSVDISISIVSHGQMDLIVFLMKDIHEHCRGLSLELLLTLNTDESPLFDEADFFYPIQVIKNTQPKGFGENHNQAFHFSHGDYFCIVNPDIRFDRCPFPDLLHCLKDARVGVVAPLVVGPTGQIEDSARRFPTIWKILGKVFRRQITPDYSLIGKVVEVDWVGGMFMLLPKAVFERLQGFDQRYFLYYEDVDLCARASLLDFRVLLCASSRVVHHAQRTSHRKLKYLRWHVTSMLRFFMSPVYRRIQGLRRP